MVKYACGGGSLIEILLAMLLISISLGATFQLNATSSQEVRYLQKSYAVQGALASFVDSSRLAYQPEIGDVFRLSGENVAYKEAVCNRNCGAQDFAQSRIREWSETLRAQIGDFQYDIDLNGEEELLVSVAWKSGALVRQASPDCAIEVDSVTSCLQMTASILE